MERLAVSCPEEAPALRSIGLAVADLRRRLGEVEDLNRRLAEVSARAAELVAENEIKNASIAQLNASLSGANAQAAELVAENEIRTQQLAETNAFLRDAVEKKSKWLGFAAHDLRGGIGGIHSLVTMLLEDPGEPGDLEGPLRLIEEESARLLELLSALLEMARGEQGRISLDRQPTDLEALTRSAMDFHARAASAKRQTLALEAAGSCPSVVADPHRIRQVIDNLISNAVKFGPVGSRIAIALSPAPGEVVWSIADEGAGLAPEDFPKLFHSFQKLSALPTAGETSTGLGLALSRNIVDLHLGRIWAENRSDGKGARFTFALPTAPSELPPLRVLVLDTDRTCRERACEALSALGHAAMACDAVPEAAIKVEGWLPHAVLADIHIPPHEIRRGLGLTGSSGQQVPLIALSSSDGGLASSGTEWDGEILKPVDPERLRALLHRLLHPNPSGSPRESARF